MMPTTRRGRYLLYRARARARKKREEDRRPYGNNTSKRETSRMRQYDLWGKQAAKSYPRYVHPENTWTFQNPAYWITPPSKGVFPVVRDLYQLPPFLPYAYHLRQAIIGFQWRRVLSMPRTKHMPWKPYLQSREAVPPEKFYQLEYYPSGARSYYWRTYVD